ncbi:MAG TPA: transcription antitermination factor NusB [Candidatus Limnocylindria bacterium]|nr:transcription antitermination factor NusB [Candidatus Limnocylindria bacterium]
MTRVRSGRHPARRLALQTLFESDFQGPRLDPKSTWERGVHRAGLSETAGRFAWELVDGVLAHRPELDAEIGRLAPEWPVAQLAPIDRNILRIALYELRHQPDTPAAAVIDEAVELAKNFGGDASPKFVNGVLASAVRDRPPS